MHVRGVNDPVAGAGLHLLIFGLLCARSGYASAPSSACPLSAVEITVAQGRKG